MIVLSTVGLVLAVTPTGVVAEMTYNAKKGLNMLDVTLNVIDPLIAQNAIDVNSNPITTVVVDGGTKFFMKGTVTDKTTGQLTDGVTVHLYAKMGGQFVTYVAGCSGTSEPSGCEWNSEVTSGGGQWSSMWTQPAGNAQDWLEVRSDGIYQGAKNEHQWTGNPAGQTLTLFATMWAGDGSFKGRTADLNIQVSAASTGINAVASTMINSCGPYTTGQSGTCQTTSPLAFQVTFTTAADQVSSAKVVWAGPGSGSQTLTKSSTNPALWTGTVTLVPGTYSIQVIAYGSGSSSKQVLSITYDGSTINGNGPSQWLYVWIVTLIIGVSMVAYSTRLD